MDVCEIGHTGSRAAGECLCFLFTEIVNHLWTRTGNREDVSALTPVLFVQEVHYKADTAGIFLPNPRRRTCFPSHNEIIREALSQQESRCRSRHQLLPVCLHLLLPWPRVI